MKTTTTFLLLQVSANQDVDTCANKQIENWFNVPQATCGNQLDPHDRAKEDVDDWLDGDNNSINRDCNSKPKKCLQRPV